MKKKRNLSHLILLVLVSLSLWSCGKEKVKEIEVIKFIEVDERDPEVDSVEQELEDQNKKSEKLEQNLERTENALEEAKADQLTTAQSLSDLQDKYDDLLKRKLEEEQMVRQLDDKLASKIRELEALSKGKNSLNLKEKEKVKNLQAEVQKLTQTKKELKASVESMASKLAPLAGRNSELVASKEKLKTELQEVEDQLNQVEGVNDELAQKKVQLEASLQDVTGELNQLAGENSELAKQQAQRLQEIKQLKEVIKESSLSIEKLKAGYGKMSSDDQRKYRELQKSQTQLKSQKEQAMVMVESLKRELEENQSKNQELLQKEESLNSLEISLAQEMDELTLAREEFEKLKKAFAEKNREEIEIINGIEAFTCEKNNIDTEIINYKDLIKKLGGELISPFNSKYDSTVEGFQKYLEDSGVQYFNAKELSLTGSTGPASNKVLQECEIPNLLPSKGCWIRGVALAKLSDSFREHLKKPIIVGSWWRPLCYNKGIGGAVASDHISATALDLSLIKSVRREKVVKFVCENFWKDDSFGLARPQDRQLDISVGIGDTMLHIGVMTPRKRRHWLYQSIRDLGGPKSECWK
jgi:chromosome segregation ATPase